MEFQIAVVLNFNVYAKYLKWRKSKDRIHVTEEDERS